MGNIKSYQEMSNDDLTKQINKLMAEYIDKKLAILDNSLKDTSILKKLRKDTARIKTLLNERKNHE